LGSGQAAREQFGSDGLQSRLGRRLETSIQLFEAFTPPGHADRAEPSIAAGGNGIGEGEIEPPERPESRPKLVRQLLERDLAITVEPPLSDR
jgi:hypothetical protein